MCAGVGCVARSINRTLYYMSLQVEDQQLGNSLIHRCFHVGRRPVVKFIVVLQITSPLPSQLCMLKLHIIVEGTGAKCLRTKAGGRGCPCDTAFARRPLPASDHSAVSI